MARQPFLVVLILLSIICLAPAQAERVLTIGVPAWPEDFNFLQDTSGVPVGSVYSQLTQSGILTRRTSGEELVGISGLSFSSDKELIVSVVSGAKFSNGSNISAIAIEEGINSCAMAVSSGVSARSRKNNRVVVSLRGEVTDPRLELLNVLRACVISDHLVVRAMASDYGIGTNSVGMGPYFPDSYKPGRSVTFQAARTALARKQSFERIEVRAIDSASTGLAALRLGNLELAISSDRGVLEEAARDNTLAVGRCGAIEYVARASLSVPCIGERLLFSEVRNG